MCLPVKRTKNYWGELGRFSLLLPFCLPFVCMFLSVSTSLSVFVSVSVCSYVYIYLYIYFEIDLLISLYVFLSFCVEVSIRFFLSLSLFLFSLCVQLPHYTSLTFPLPEHTSRHSRDIRSQIVGFCLHRYKRTHTHKHSTRRTVQRGSQVRPSPERKRKEKGRGVRNCEEERGEEGKGEGAPFCCRLAAYLMD